MKKRFCLFALMAVCASMNHLEVAASLEGYEDFRDKIGYQSADSDEEEGSALMGPGVHSTFRLQRGEAHEGLVFDFEVALKGLDVFDQNLARAAVAAPNGCPNWSLLPMDTEAGRVRAHSVARILTAHYAYEKKLCAQQTDRHVWGLKATALGVSYEEARTRGVRAQEEAENACCGICCMFFC
ncbi:MAG: hypothetical protein C0514_06740 [Candidatus Puniceispirillum sp.]|nr:hypothetical protein [Candidatus Puniceispirillum sp.]